jgi:hypothetical protein
MSKLRNNAPLTVRIYSSKTNIHTNRAAWLDGPGGRLHPVSFSPQARIKKLMQSDDDVGKVAKAAPVLIGGWDAGCF